MAVSAVTYKVDGRPVLIAAPRVGLTRIKKVTFNGGEVTEYHHQPAAPSDPAIWTGHLDPKLAHAGDNLVQACLRPGSCVPAAFSLLFMSDEMTWTEEFVPEPGTVAFLGSGLACLAGYPGLRLRRRR